MYAYPKPGNASKSHLDSGMSFDKVNGRPQNIEADGGAVSCKRKEASCETLWVQEKDIVVYLTSDASIVLIVHTGPTSIISNLSPK
eukprot:4350835-Amphidinium_carterae.1